MGASPTARKLSAAIALIASILLVSANATDAAAKEPTFSAKEYAKEHGGTLTDLRAASKRANALLPQPKPAGETVGPAPMAVPVDAFGLEKPFFGAEPNGPDGSPRFSVWGGWDYRDDYVNGSDPDDFATIRLDLPDCYKIIESGVLTYRYDGAQTDVGYLKDGGVGSGAPIFGLRNVASNFTLSADNGLGFVVLEKTSNCSGEVGAMFSYEHNQDGGAVTGVSASWGGFTVNYQGSPLTLQKSTNPVYFEI